MPDFTEDIDYIKSCGPVAENCGTVSDDCKTGDCATDASEHIAQGIPSRCMSIFDRVAVSHLVRGCTSVFWELTEDFYGVQPFEFQLQVSEAPHPVDDAWTDVGPPVIDQFLVQDNQRRAYGKINRTHYRVKLTEADGTEHFSDPTGMMGTLRKSDWNIARELLRQETLAFKSGHSAQQGYLLKRRITGEDCPECLDHLTNEITDPNCRICWGTGKRCGYYYPVCNVWADFDPKTYRTHLDAGQSRGTVLDIVVRARMLNTWLLGEEDVWINQKTDDRYYIHTVQNVVEIRGIPIAANVELRPAPFTDIIYEIPVSAQNAVSFR